MTVYSRSHPLARVSAVVSHHDSRSIPAQKPRSDLANRHPYLAAVVQQGESAATAVIYALDWMRTNTAKG
jgi:hypothetical protein